MPAARVTSTQREGGSASDQSSNPRGDSPAPRCQRPCRTTIRETLLYAIGRSCPRRPAPAPAPGQAPRIRLAWATISRAISPAVALFSTRRVTWGANASWSI